MNFVLCELEHSEKVQGLSGGRVVKNLPANVGNTGTSPGLGRSHKPESKTTPEVHATRHKVLQQEQPPQ